MIKHSSILFQRSTRLYIMIGCLLLFVSAFTAANATAAQGDESLTLSGVSTLDSDLDNDSDPDEVDQGGTADWLLEYENTSGEFLPNAEINNVLSPGQEYIVGSSKAPPGWDVSYSTDNGSTYAATEPAIGVTDILFSNQLISPEAGGTLTELPEPLQAVNQGTGGDGFVPILAGDRIYAIFHHQNFKLSCIDRTTNTVCPGYPKLVTQQVDATTYSFIADQSPGGGVFINDLVYMMGYRSDGAFGLLCWDSSTDDLCDTAGYTVMATGYGHGTGWPRAWGPQAIGNEIYLISDNHQIHCFDTSTNTLCSGYPKNSALVGSVAAGNAGGLIDMETDAATGRIYGAYRGYIHCFDTNTDAPCANWSEPVYTNNSQHNGLFFRKATNGVRNGICVRPWQNSGGSTVTCYNLDGTTPSTLPTTFNCGGGTTGYCGYWQIHTDTEVGSKLILSSWIGNGSAFCWDWVTNAPCQGAGYVNGVINHVSNTGQTTLEYGAVSDGTCVYSLGDRGLLHTFDPVTGTAPCSAVDSITTPSLRVTPAEFTCDGSVPNFTWNKLEVTDANMTSGVHFTSFQVTILDDSNNVVLGPVEMIGGNGTLDLSGISNSTTSIRAQINPTPVNGNPAWQNNNTPKVSITYIGDPIQMCFQTTPVVNCEGPDTISTEATSAVSGLVVSDSLNVYPGAECD
ncbi:MAG: hypothetical protein KDE51_23465, partial [Anaerolineales bacterium]|nr:hypothetical protein [Anaerolineales bacterium]